MTLHNSSSSSTDRYVDISPTALSANRTLTIPDKSGTIALTSDIPTGGGSGGGAFTKVWSGTLSLDDGVISDAYNNCTYPLLIIYSNVEDAYGFLLGQQCNQREWVFTGTMKQPGGDNSIIDFEDMDGQYYSNTLSITDCEVYAVYNIGG